MHAPKILLIEDDLLIAKLYADLLANEKYAVEIASDGESGLQKLQAGGWDLVLLDFLLPKMNGLDIVKKIRTNPPARTNKKIVFLTDYNHEDKLKEINMLGYEYLIKSTLTPDQILEKVRAYLVSSE